METSETVSSHLEQQMYISQPNQTRESLEGISEPLQVRVAPGLQSPPPSLPHHQPPSLLSVQVPPLDQEEASGGGYRSENRDPYDGEDDSESGDGGRYGQNRSSRVCHEKEKTFLNYCHP